MTKEKIAALIEHHTFVNQYFYGIGEGYEVGGIKEAAEAIFIELAEAIFDKLEDETQE
jgi:hypothetical protein